MYFNHCPLELRHEIYALLLDTQGSGKKDLHLSRQAGKIRLSACLGADQDKSSWRLSENIDRHNYELAARRFRSIWGLHWKCEEALLSSLKGR
jgi:hypothetical protein